MLRPSSFGAFSTTAISLNFSANSSKICLLLSICAISRPRKRSVTLTLLPFSMNFLAALFFVFKSFTSLLSLEDDTNEINSKAYNCKRLPHSEEAFVFYRACRGVCVAANFAGEQCSPLQRVCVITVSYMPQTHWARGIPRPVAQGRPRRNHRAVRTPRPGRASRKAATPGG